MFGIAIPPVGNTVTGGSDFSAVIAAIVLSIVAVVLLSLAFWGARGGHKIAASVEAPAAPRELPHAA